MNIVITDSGLGGLSIAAELHKQLNLKKINDCNITFANALPEANQGYNTMPDTEKKISVFNKALHGFENLSPDLVAVACNTLSVIIPETIYYKNNKNKVIEIIQSGVNGYLKKIRKEEDFYTIILGTDTTIKSNILHNTLIKHGLDKRKVISQSCTTLASEIEKDYKSDMTKDVVKQSLKEAVSNIDNTNSKLYLYLGCTHYGYVENIFLDELNTLGFRNVSIYNPNIILVSDIMKRIKELSFLGSKNLNFEVISKAEILPEEINSISELLKNDYPFVVSKLLDYRRLEDLF